MPGERRPDDLDGGINAYSPAGMYDEWPGSLSAPDPGGDLLAADSKRRGRPRLVGGPVAGGQQRAVRHAHGRQVERRSEVQRESGPSRVVTPSRIQQQNVRPRRETSYQLLDQRP